jgi:hypothetical protein
MHYLILVTEFLNQFHGQVQGELLKQNEDKDVACVPSG